MDVDIIALSPEPGHEPPVSPSAQEVRTHLCSGRNSLSALLRGNSAYESELRLIRRSTPSDLVIHDHGIWLPTNHWVAGMSRSLGVPRVVSPRGMLSPWALGYQRWKKKVAWLAYQHRDLRSATALHVTSEEEAEEVRALGLRQPLVVLPNGVDVPDKTATFTAEAGERSALFLSRIHPKKGLLNLVNAWSRVRPRQWRLIIAGPDDSGHAKEVERLAAAEGIASQIEFIGSVPDSEKWDLYRRAHLFVLPTFSENFGIVIAEALATGLPVITTVGAPWRKVLQYHCGWWVDLGVEPLAAALKEATDLGPAQLAEMGARGRDLVSREFSWSHIATKMHEAYLHLLGKARRPSMVYTD